MLQTAQRSVKSKKKKAAPPHERFLEAFRWMLLARTLEEKLVSLYRGGLITGGVYIGKGQEAVSVACGLFLPGRRRLRPPRRVANSPRD